ncbi:hypothetical protein SAMN05660226_02286 [Parapedobacter luteus]|uniref:Outer membrane protein beta-barrel family protein n=1 Tax=Parapedobacter luteus TaxID=623280 RepID=A0A1T5CS19_9SPHI|nr:hypothetical protein [Parapedobacter luteus]SKB62272.1 hypothetical protein SAMN05660226_02286 [Parapedobacter luteus]
MRTKIYFRHCVLFFLISCYATNLLGQNDVNNQSNPSKRLPKVRGILTEVFILNTGQPSQLSLARIGDNTDILNNKILPRKMELHYKRPSAFKIQGINPLRYQYYINNESISYFMDVTAQTTVLTNLIGDGFLSPSEINVPQIFKAEIKKSDKRDQLIIIEQQIKDYKDSISKYEIKTQELWADYESKYPHYDENGNQFQIPSDVINEFMMKRSPYDTKISSFAQKLNVKFEEYERHIVSLPIHGSAPSFLRDYLSNDYSLSEHQSIKDIEIRIRVFTQYYNSLAKDFREIDSILSHPPRSEATVRRNSITFGNEREEYRQQIDQLISLLSKYNYTLTGNPFIPYTENTQSALYTYGLSMKSHSTNIKEFLINKRYQVFEEFIFETATKIGLLLQNQFKELSQLNNSLYQTGYISKSTLDSVTKQERELNETFEFVQRVSAEFQILVSYLDIDNRIYSQIADQINSNYRNLLGYLKILAFVKKNNTIEFTLPSSTNLKNIDLVRYKIERKDRLKGSDQSYVYDFWIRGGIKIDFSAGLFASGLTDNDYQKHIYYNDGEATDSLQINRQLTGDYNFAFGGMINVAPRLGTNWLTPGISFGAVYSTNQKLQFLVAGSLNIGKTERIILHGGIAMGSIRSIDLSQHQMTIVKSNSIYRVKANNDDFTIPTLERFSVRPVFGLTYNLSKKNALQAVVDTKTASSSN